MKKILLSLALITTLFGATILPVKACTPTLTPPKMSDDYYKALDSAYEAGKKVGENATISTGNKDMEASDEITKVDESGAVDESFEVNSSFVKFSNFYENYYRKWFNYFRR